MSSTVIRNAIATVLATVPDIGVIHGYERYTDKTRDFREFYQRDGKILGWSIRRIGFSEIVETDTVSTVRSRWQIKGYRSLDDDMATEIEFDELVDLVADVFRAKPTLDGAVAATGARGETPIQLEDSGPVRFAGVLCHEVRLSLLTEHYVSTEVPEDGVVPSNVYASRAPNIGEDHKEDYRDVQTGEAPDD